ncbi:MAG: hypothetical protein Tsb002_31530 [Wenzhouxiangellaceae bacterium]
MHCFNHENAEAVGICKHCSKGVCADCVTDLGFGLACKNLHEAQVEAVNAVIENNTRIYAAAPANSLITPVFYLFMGIVFAAYGYQSRDGLTSLAFIMGVGFIIFSLVVYLRTKVIWQYKKSK